MRHDWPLEDRKAFEMYYVDRCPERMPRAPIYIPAWVAICSVAGVCLAFWFVFAVGAVSIAQWVETRLP